VLRRAQARNLALVDLPGTGDADAVRNEIDSLNLINY
jgi:hypothetical protein